jgi:hypothetical protein
MADLDMVRASGRIGYPAASKSRPGQTPAPGAFATLLGSEPRDDGREPARPIDPGEHARPRVEPATRPPPAPSAHHPITPRPVPAGESVRRAPADRAVSTARPGADGPPVPAGLAVAEAADPDTAITAELTMELCENDQDDLSRDPPPGLTFASPGHPMVASQPVVNPYAAGLTLSLAISARQPDDGGRITDADANATSALAPPPGPLDAIADMRNSEQMAGASAPDFILDTQDPATNPDATSMDPALLEPLGNADPAAALGADTLATTQPPLADRDLPLGPPPAPVIPPQRGVVMRLSQALRDGEDALTITLHPADLGRVQIRLAVADDGVRVEMTLDRQETFDTFRQDTAGLERQFAEAGISLADRGLDLRFGQSSSGERRDDPPQPPPPAARTPVAAVVVRDGLIDITA